MSRALLTLYSQPDRLRACRWIDQAPPGTRVEFREVKRSLPQNDLLWARLTEIACKVDWYGQKLNTADWKDVFTASLRQARVVPGIEPGTFVVLGLHTSDMGKQEMSNLLDLIDAFAAERGVYFRDQEREAS